CSARPSNVMLLAVSARMTSPHDCVGDELTSDGLRTRRPMARSVRSAAAHPQPTCSHGESGGAWEATPGARSMGAPTSASDIAASSLGYDAVTIDVPESSGNAICIMRYASAPFAASPATMPTRAPPGRACVQCRVSDHVMPDDANIAGSPGATDASSASSTGARFVVCTSEICGRYFGGPTSVSAIGFAQKRGDEETA